MATMSLGKALNSGLRRAMEHDPKVVLMGEDIGKLGGVFRVTEGLQRDFGDRRVIDTPLAESGVIGTAVGLALRGDRPVCEIQFDGFIYPAFDQIVSQVAKLHYRNEGRVTVPLTIRVPFGGGCWPWSSSAALARLAGHDWPGNVRELSNVLCRAADVAARQGSIDADDIERALRRDRPVAARAAGIPRTSFRRCWGLEDGSATVASHAARLREGEGRAGAAGGAVAVSRAGAARRMHARHGAQTRPGNVERHFRLAGLREDEVGRLQDRGQIVHRRAGPVEDDVRITREI